MALVVFNQLSGGFESLNMSLAFKIDNKF